MQCDSRALEHIARANAGPSAPARRGICPPALAKPVCRDPDDDAVLALAIAAQADLIVSGDDDLLSLTHFEGIPILTPVQALERVLDSL